MNRLFLLSNRCLLAGSRKFAVGGTSAASPRLAGRPLLLLGVIHPCNNFLELLQQRMFGKSIQRIREKIQHFIENPSTKSKKKIGILESRIEKLRQKRRHRSRMQRRKARGKAINKKRNAQKERRQEWHDRKRHEESSLATTTTLR